MKTMSGWKGFQNIFTGCRRPENILTRVWKRLLSVREAVASEKLLSGPYLVNQSMAMISDKKKQPFDGAREALKSIRSYADVVVVTAANGQKSEKNGRLSR